MKSVYSVEAGVEPHRSKNFQLSLCYLDLNPKSKGTLHPFRENPRRDASSGAYAHLYPKNIPHLDSNIKLSIQLKRSAYAINTSDFFVVFQRKFIFFLPCLLIFSKSCSIFYIMASSRKIHLVS